MPIIVAVSGINGVGKTTIIRKLELRLLAGGITTTVYKAPYYESETGQIIKRFLAGEQIDNIEEIFALNRQEV